MLIIWYGLNTTIIIIQTILPVKNPFKILKQYFAKLNPYQNIVESSEIDILHVPMQYSPIYHTKVPVIITMHDLQEYHFPEYFSLRARLHRFINNKMAIFDSDHIIVSFDHIKNDILTNFKVEEKKISVCPVPVADNWFVASGETNWEELKAKYDLQKIFLLYPAATWQHKNHIRLIEVLHRLLQDDIDVYLVCTGNKTGYFPTIERKIAELGLSEKIKFLGIIPEEDLIGLYKNCELVVIPTLYEAGSGPLYEAMRYACPVICSNVTSLPDTVSNDEFVFDPKNLNELEDKIKLGILDKEFRKRNIDNSRKRIEQFANMNFSSPFVNVYNSLIETDNKSNTT
jgi:glycosyltransferase involved in cell wall biosynthesis